MTHRTAPLPPEGRLRLVLRCRYRPIAHIAAEAGISRQCLGKWVARYRKHGEAGFGVRVLEGQLAVEIRDWSRFTGNSTGSHLKLVPSESFLGSVPVAGADHQDRHRARRPTVGRGRLAPPGSLHPRQGDP